MSRDLFGDVAFRSPSVRSRRSPAVVASIVVHALLVVGVLLATAIAPDLLPTPREALAFYEPARLIDIQLPPPPPAPRLSPPTPEVPAGSPDAAPVVAPSSIVPEMEAALIRPSGSGVVSGITGNIGVDITGGVVDALPPAPAIRTPQAPMPLHRGISAPEKVLNVMPAYPEVARQIRLEAIVILETIIDASGDVTTARVLRGHPLLNQAAVDAVTQWKFKPATLNGEAVPVVMTVTVQFKIQ